MSRGGIFQAVDDWSRELKAYLKAEGQNWGLESRFVVWKANFSHKGLTWCLEGWLKIWRADLRFRGQIWDLEDRFEAGWLLILGLANWIEGWKGNFEALMANGGGWTEGWTFGNSSPPPVFYWTWVLRARRPKRICKACYSNFFSCADGWRDLSVACPQITRLYTLPPVVDRWAGAENRNVSWRKVALLQHLCIRQGAARVIIGPI